MLVINRRIRIPLREFDFQFARSGGPGGQNVNKLSTKAILRWGVERSPSLPEDVRERFCARFRRRITREGEFVLTSQRFRDQGRNVADCIEKLRNLMGNFVSTLLALSAPILRLTLCSVQTERFWSTFNFIFNFTASSAAK